MRLIFKNLNILRSTINAISTNFEIKDIVESAGSSLPSLFNFASFGFLWKPGLLLYSYQDESCLPSFTQDVVKNMVKVLTSLGEDPIDINRIVLQVEKRRLKTGQSESSPRAALKSHLTLPLALEMEIVGCISLNSDQPNTFDAQDLQFFSVIGYQMAASLKHFQRFSSIKNMAIYDTLTSLHNRRYFEEKLRIDAQKAFGTQTSLSLIMIDIDHFKKVNDTFGHPAGDVILREIASLLKKSVRGMDTVARYGGEEFILILPGAKVEASHNIAERIRRLVESTTFDVGTAHLNMSISLGISNFPVHPARSGEELIKMADQALYEAKRGGRNRVCIFKPNQT